MRVLLFLILCIGADSLGLDAGAKINAFATEVELLPALKLRGSGCHRDMIGPDAGRICSGVIIDEGLRHCEQLYEGRHVADGGTEFRWRYFGSACEPPGPQFVDLAHGLFFLEDSAGRGYTVICDDARVRDQKEWAAAREACCQCDGGAGGPRR